MAAGVRIDGLRELRRDLKRIDATLPRRLNADLKRAAEPIAVAARGFAPKGPTGRLRRQIKVRTAGSKLFIGTGRLPYGRAVHFGLRHPVFGNRQVWAANPRRPFILQAVRSGAADGLEKAIYHAIDRLMREAGFH